MNSQTAIAILRQFGLRNCFFRIGYQRRKKKGYFEQVNPTVDWEELDAGSIFLPGEVAASDSLRDYLTKKTGRFFFELGKPIRLTCDLANCGYEDAVRRADRLQDGYFFYFFREEGKLGTPGPEGPTVDWFLNPFTGQRDTQMVHWSRRGDFDPDRGDIKYIWEPARFAWVYDLVRAYSATGDDRYPTLFWHLVNSWMQANPVAIGPGWQCGQEAAIRVMAVCFGLWAFFDHPSSDEKNLLQAVRLLATLGARIEVNLDYAKSQRSNHSSTEALGLVMLGLLFPTMRHADRWLRLGRQTMEYDARHHFWSDGSYLMHSLNYQRMTMHCFLWAMRLAELAEAPFPDAMYEKMARATRFLYQMQDDSGRVPNYGSNDGALICPLSGCDYLDYRPFLEAMTRLCERKQVSPVACDGLEQKFPAAGDRANVVDSSPFQEEQLWLFGAVKEPNVSRRGASQFHVGGYYTLRSERSWLMTRCHDYKTRPSQADQLHVDLWYEGVNVLRDPGTFQYYDPERKRNLYFLSTAAHNTIEVNGQSQMEKGPRFYWKSLCRGRLIQADETSIIAEHDGYRRFGVIHRREIRLVGTDHWQVKDRLLGGSDDTRWKLFFHLPDVECVLEGTRLNIPLTTNAATAKKSMLQLTWQSETPLTPELFESEESLYYGHLSPARGFALSGTGGNTEVVWEIL